MTSGRRKIGSNSKSPGRSSTQTRSSLSTVRPVMPSKVHAFASGSLGQELSYLNFGIFGADAVLESCPSTGISAKPATATNVKTFIAFFPTFDLRIHFSSITTTRNPVWSAAHYGCKRRNAQSSSMREKNQQG